jgi:hypothetical protein
MYMHMHASNSSLSTGHPKEQPSAYYQMAVKLQELGKNIGPLQQNLSKALTASEASGSKASIITTEAPQKTLQSRFQNQSF